MSIHAMSLLPFDPKENLLPYDGIVNDFGIMVENPKQLYDTLFKNLPWQSDIVTVYGKTHLTKRQVVWMGDQVSYCYSGHKRVSIPWSQEVFHVKHIIEKQLSTMGVQVAFNACLLNYYPTGEEGMGYHADDEPELGHEPVIASLSLGEQRKFVLKHQRTQEKIAMWLADGHLIVMRGATQNHWKHCITKSKNIKSGRISLTFRKVSSVTV